MMKLIDYNGTSSLLIDNIERTENRIDFDVSVVLYDKRTDTDIKFKTNSYIDISDWQQKSETLLLQDKIELDKIKYFAEHNKSYYWERGKFVIHNFFDLSSNIHNCHLKFLVDSEYSFGKKLHDEMPILVNYKPVSNFPVISSWTSDGPIHISLKLACLYTENWCDIQLRIYSKSFNIVRCFHDILKEAKYISEIIQQFNEKKVEQIEIVNEFLEMEFKWIDGKKMGKGTISDFAWPGPNEFIFDDMVDIEWEHVDKEDLPLIPTKYIPADEFQVGSSMDEK